MTVVGIGLRQIADFVRPRYCRFWHVYFRTLGVIVKDTVGSITNLDRIVMITLWASGRTIRFAVFIGIIFA